MSLGLVAGLGSPSRHRAPLRSTPERPRRKTPGFFRGAGPARQSRPFEAQGGPSALISGAVPGPPPTRGQVKLTPLAPPSPRPGSGTAGVQALGPLPP